MCNRSWASVDEISWEWGMPVRCHVAARPTVRRVRRMVPKRRGLSMAELLVAMLLVMAAIVGTTQLLVRANLQYRAFDQRAVAIREAANAMEALALRPAGELRDDKANVVPVSDAARRALPDCKITVAAMAPTKNDAGLRRIVVRVSWQPNTVGPEAAVQLVAWRPFDEEAEQ